MKWFKHISDSLDDPFIFDLMDRFGADGYLVFFGILEIYSREFKAEPGWNLSVTRSYLKQKLHKRQDTLILKVLQFIATHGKLDPNSSQTHGELVTNSLETPDKLDKNSQKVFKNSGKWDVSINGEQIVVYIPKFHKLVDEFTSRKIGTKSTQSTEKIHIEAEAEVEADKELYKQPSKEIIQESSTPKITDEIERIAKHLYEEKIFIEVYAFKNKMLNGKNPRAILHTLSRCYLAKPEDPWAYCKKIMDVEDQNYNERDYGKTQE